MLLFLFLTAFRAPTTVQFCTKGCILSIGDTLTVHSGPIYMRMMFKIANRRWPFITSGLAFIALLVLVNRGDRSSTMHDKAA